MKAEETKEGKQIGRVTHYFSNIGVAVIELTDKLKVGEEIRIVGGEGTDFTQEVDSMEVDHQKIKEAKKGDSIGLKVSQKVREDYKVYKV
jgi:translation elongation factor EF-1alpha